MSAPARPAPAAPIRVAAGTTAGQAVRDAGLPARGEVDAVVVVRDADTGELVRSGRAPHPPGTEVPPSAWDAAFTAARTAAPSPSVPSEVEGRERRFDFAQHER